MLSTSRIRKHSEPVNPQSLEWKTDSKPTDDGWEMTLRDQITAHPRIALGVGLLAGILTGWWVKR